MIVFHHTSLAGLLPFLDGKLKLIPWGFGSTDTLRRAGFAWADADRTAATLLRDGAPLVQKAAAAFLSTARHTRLREATTISTLEFAATEPRSTDPNSVSLGLDHEVLDSLRHCAVVPRGATPHETLLESVLTRRAWNSESPDAKREAVLAFVATLIACRTARAGADHLLVALTSRLHHDRRLSIQPTETGELEAQLTLDLPPEALIEAVPHPDMPATQLATLSLLLRQRRLSHVVLRRSGSRSSVELDGDRTRAT